jgi:CrcB protein
MAADVEDRVERARAMAPPPAPPRPATLPIALGAVLGTGARALVGLALPAGAGGWPWATFAVNVIGSFALGAAFGRADRGRAPTWLRGPGFATGAVGSFTTFSALAVEAGGLATAVGVAYAAASLAGGLVAVALGWRAGRGRP